MFKHPARSPWGMVRDCEMLCPGVFMVTAPASAGILVSKDIAAFLSPAAKRHGMMAGGYFCFEEPTKEVIVLRELLDKKLWAAPPWIEDAAAFERMIDRALQKHHPDYWHGRQRGRCLAPPATARAMPVHGGR